MTAYNRLPSLNDFPSRCRHLLHTESSARLNNNDVGVSLVGHERVRLHNQGNRQPKHRNSVFYLDCVAIILFTNHKDKIAIWQEFKTDPLEIFGKPFHACVQAGVKTAVIFTETYGSNNEDVLAFCRYPDKDMAQMYRVRHVIKVISKEP